MQLKKCKTLIVSVWCSQALTPGAATADYEANDFLLLPDSNAVSLMPALSHLIVWPRFADEKDAAEQNCFRQTVVRLLNLWSASLVCAEVITGKDQELDMQLSEMPLLRCFVMSHITAATMQSLLQSAPLIQEIVYLRSGHNRESLSAEWLTIEKKDQEPVSPETLAIDMLTKHQSEWEKIHQKAGTSC